MYILWTLAIWSHRQIMGSHSAKLRKYSSAVPCAKTGVRTLCRNGCHASVAKHISRRDSTSTMATTLHAHKLVHTGRRGSTRSCGCNSKRTLLSYTYLKSCLFFFLSSRKESGLTDPRSKYWQKPPAPRTGSQPARQNWAPLNLVFFNSFGLSQGWRKFLRARDQIVDNFRRNSLSCTNISSLASYFQLCQWLLSVP